MREIHDIQNVAEFTKRLEKLSDVDIGDFKRKVGHYITELEGSLTSKSPAQKEVLNRLRMLVVYNNQTTDVDMIRHQAIEMVQRLS